MPLSNIIVYWLHYCFYTILILCIPFIYLPLLFELNPFAIAYLLWYIWDFQTCDYGSRPFRWLRQLSFWSYFTQSFPLHLIRSTQLSSDRNYIFACHPHGIFSISTVHSIITDGQQFSQLFPNLQPYFVTISQQFWLPFYREILLAFGFCSAKQKSIEYILKQKPNSNVGGNIVAIMIGGTNEAIESFHSNRLILIVKKRRGFLRLALKNRASIVPVISFGENNLYHTVNLPDLPSSSSLILNYIQKTFKSIIGFPLKIFYGNLLFFPYRKPVWTVVGEPILIDEKISEPTKHQIDQLQEQYINALQRLYEQYKHQYNHGNIELVIK